MITTSFFSTVYEANIGSHIKVVINWIGQPRASQSSYFGHSYYLRPEVQVFFWE